MGRALVFASLWVAVQLPALGAAAQSLPPPADAPTLKPLPPDLARLPAAFERALEPEVRWYGWQTLLADAAILTITYFEPIVFLAFPFAAPGIHALNGNFVPMFVSLGLRLAGAALFITGLVWSLNNIDFDSDPTCEGDCPGNGDGRDGTPLIVGGMATWSVAIVVDAVLATKRTRPEAPRPGWNVQPWVSPQTRAGGLTLTRRF
jgi:hypothetical protein